MIMMIINKRILNDLNHELGALEVQKIRSIEEKKFTNF